MGEPRVGGFRSVEVLWNQPHHRLSREKYRTGREQSRALACDFEKCAAPGVRDGQGGGCWLARLGRSVPSATSQYAPGSNPTTGCVFPDGQYTVTFSIRESAPSPKSRRGSLVEA